MENGCSTGFTGKSCSHGIMRYVCHSMQNADLVCWSSFSCCFPSIVHHQAFSIFAWFLTCILLPVFYCPAQWGLSSHYRSAFSFACLYFFSLLLLKWYIMFRTEVVEYFTTFLCCLFHLENVTEIISVVFTRRHQQHKNGWLGMCSNISTVSPTAKVYHPTTNDNFDSSCPIPVILV